MKMPTKATIHDRVDPIPLAVGAMGSARCLRLSNLGLEAIRLPLQPYSSHSQRSGFGNYCCVRRLHNAEDTVSRLGGNQNCG